MIIVDCFESTKWDVFKIAATRGDSVDLNEYTTAVTGYISTCTENIIPTRHVKMYTLLLKVFIHPFKTFNSGIPITFMESGV